MSREINSASPAQAGTQFPDAPIALNSPAIDDPKAISEGKLRIWLDQCFAYRSLDKVSGSIDHSLIDCDRIKVHLMGTTFITHVRFINGAYRPLEAKWDFLKLTQKLNLGSEASPMTLFSFRLPDSLLETLCPLRNPHHLLLPPTIGCKRQDGLDDMSPKDPINARIEYNIVTEFFKGGNMVKTLRKSFRVAPRHFTSSRAANPPPEYNEVISVEADVNRVIGGKIGSLKITGQQPPALLTSLEEHQLTTKVPIQLEYHSTQGQPPPLAAIGIKLRANTSSSVEHSLEGGLDVTRSVDVRLNKLVFSKNSAPLWRAHRPGKWIIDLDVPVTLAPKGFVAIPEFNSCLVDRQYQLTLKFEFASTGLPLSETRLTIPTWIFADEYYGIPSESGAGQPVKQIQRFTVPKDVELDGPGSLPGYEDTYLSNLAGAPSRNPIIVGEGGTSAAPFTLAGREPDYFARPRAMHPTQRQNRPMANGAGPSTIDGVEPDDEEESEQTRVPAWQIKALERPNGQQDPRDQDGAQ